MVSYTTRCRYVVDPVMTTIGPYEPSNETVHSPTIGRIDLATEYPVT